MKVFLFILFGLGIPFISFSQTSYQFGSLPTIYIDKKLNSKYSIIYKNEYRHEYRHGYFNKKSEYNYQFIHLDFSLIGIKKINENLSFGIGYIARVTKDETLNRTLLQLVFKKEYNHIKTSHRLVSDQTFSKIINDKYRLRYRFSSKFPIFKNKELNTEKYIKLNNEYLYSLTNDGYDFEIRILPYLGFIFNENNKLEIGMDYRINSFLHDSPYNRIWIGVNWYLKL